MSFYRCPTADVAQIKDISFPAQKIWIKGISSYAKDLNYKSVFLH